MSIKKTGYVVEIVSYISLDREHYRKVDKKLLIITDDDSVTADDVRKVAHNVICNAFNGELSLIDWHLLDRLELRTEKYCGSDEISTGIGNIHITRDPVLVADEHLSILEQYLSTHNYIDICDKYIMPKNAYYNAYYKDDQNEEETPW